MRPARVRETRNSSQTPLAVVPGERYKSRSMINARVVRIREPGDPSVLEIGDASVREPGFGELLVAVKAAGVNRADVMQRRGFYPAPKGVVVDVPGLEYAGVVESVGAGDTGFSPGERVMGIVGGGAMSTRVVVHERDALRVPSALSLTDAAAIPEVFLTVWDALFVQARVAAGDTVLVHAVASGIGTAAIQLCHAMHARVIGTARTAAKLERLKTEHGLRESVTVTDGKFACAVEALTGGRGVDAVLDSVGAAYLEENVRSLAPRGRLVLLGLMGGASGTIPLGALLMKRATLIGTTLRARPLEEKAALAQDFAKRVLPLFETGALRPVIDAVMPMTEARAAHERMERNDTLGKLVLTWD